MSKSVALTLTAAVALGSAYWFFARGDDDEAEEDDAQYLPKVMILDIFTELSKQMPAKMAALMQQLEVLIVFVYYVVSLPCLTVCSHPYPGSSGA
jgi:hypothetical protein